MHITMQEFTGNGWRTEHYAKASKLERQLCRLLFSEAVLRRFRLFMRGPHDDRPLVESIDAELQVLLLGAKPAAAHVNHCRAADTVSFATPIWPLVWDDVAEAVRMTLEYGVPAAVLREYAEAASLAAGSDVLLPAMRVLRGALLERCRTIAVRPDWLVVACDRFAETGDVDKARECVPVASAA